ncbi:MAG: GNAT family N-acetyltransferase, partial [Bacillota bacterium]|nr:GNAT family N-acetyltransferase [Bacillota bacterium]
SNPEIFEFQYFRPQTLQEVENFIISKVSEMPDVPGTWYQLAVVAKETKALIGDIGIHFMEADTSQVEIGFTLSREYQGKGYAFEAVAGVLNYIFGSMNKHRIIASVDPRNSKSIALLERIGMRREAHFIKSIWFNNQWTDDVVYAILEEEWKANANIS